MENEALQEMTESIVEEATMEPGGFFGSIAGIWRSMVDEVLPAWEVFWTATRRLWHLLEDFLARWVGEPILNNINEEKFWIINDGARDFIQGLNDGFWGFFLN